MSDFERRRRCAWCGNPVNRAEGHVVEHAGDVAVWHPLCVDLDETCWRWPVPRHIVIQVVRKRGGGRVVEA